LDGDRGPAPDRVEVGPGGLEEDGVVEKAVYGFELGGHPQADLRQDGFPQARLGVYGGEHGGRSPFSHKGFRPSSQYSGRIASTLRKKNRCTTTVSGLTFSGASS